MERMVCRLLASWCSLCAYWLLKDAGFGELAYRQGMSMGFVCLCGGLLFFVYSFFCIILQPYETDSWFLMLSASVCVIRWITASSEFLFLLSVVLAYSFFVLYFIWKNDLLRRRWDPGRRTVWCLSIVCALICASVIGVITCLRYLTFSAPNFDFGIFVNMFHHMRESGEPLCSCERDVMMSHFAVHLSPVWYILLPFYAIFPSPLTLQIGQAVAVASGVIPVVLLCRCRRLSGRSTVLAAIVYCCYPALTTGCFFDIHENCFLAPLLLWTFYFFEREKYVPMYVFAGLTLLVKEDAAVYVVFFALYAFFAGKKCRHGIFLAVGALAYFAAALTVLRHISAYYMGLYAQASPNPAIGGPMIGRYDSLIYNTSEDGLIGAFKTVLVNPGYLLKQMFFAGDHQWDKWKYFLQMLLPVGCLPFFTRKPARWILMAPILLNLLTNYSYQYHLNYQYHFGISVFLIYGAILNLSDMRPCLRRAAAGVALAACCCFYIAAVYAPLRTNIRLYRENREQYIRMEEILQTIPKDASVCCSTFLLPHLADRDEVYEIHYHEGEGNVDYVIFDARYPIDQKALHVFGREGYVVLEEHEKLLLILVKKDGS